MVFVIKEPGLLSTFQDLGRYGFQSTGISPSGALDYKSAILANQIVGNDFDEAIIEMQLTGISFDVLKDTTIGVVGAQMEITVNGKKTALGRPIPLSRGDFVKLGFVKDGMRTYLAVAGGFKLDRVLNSYSTHLRTNMGGYKGRALETGDVIPYGEDKKKQHMLIVKDSTEPVDNKIRIIPGPNFVDLTDESKEDFVKQPYKITRSNDRMGIRLEGKPLATNNGVHDILSEPTQLGNIQVPKSGLPIILLNDRQTTGGYKRMASVAKIDLPKLVQLRPETEIYFEWIDLKEAVALYRQELQNLRSKEYLKVDTEYTYYRRIKAERVKQLIKR